MTTCLTEIPMRNLPLVLHRDDSTALCDICCEHLTGHEYKMYTNHHIAVCDASHIRRIFFRLCDACPRLATARTLTPAFNCDLYHHGDRSSGRAALQPLASINNKNRACNPVAR